MTEKISPQEHLNRAAVHESGHAVMACINGIQCSGVFWEYEPIAGTVPRKGKFCTPVGNKPPWKTKDYLQIAAGAGAEKLFFGGYIPATSEHDRQKFDAPGAPDWEETVEEAKAILANKNDELTAMATLFLQRSPSIRSLPDRGMKGHSTRYKELLSEDEVIQIAGSDRAATRTSKPKKRNREAKNSRAKHSRRKH